MGRLPLVLLLWGVPNSLQCHLLMANWQGILQSRPRRPGAIVQDLKLPQSVGAATTSLYSVASPIPAWMFCG